MDISKNIIAIREAKRIKQIEVANALGIDAPNYSRLEKRGVEMSIKQLSDIAVALGVTIDDILHYGEEKTQIVDNERVKELENRIKELESIIKDKETLLQYVRNQVVDRYFLSEYSSLLNFYKKITIPQMLEIGLDEYFANNFIKFRILSLLLRSIGKNDVTFFKDVLSTNILGECVELYEKMKHDKNFIKKYKDYENHFFTTKTDELI
jgi:transcriptional regulator with XRE-family HTH domain